VTKIGECELGDCSHCAAHWPNENVISDCLKLFDKSGRLMSVGR